MINNLIGKLLFIFNLLSSKKIFKKNFQKKILIIHYYLFIIKRINLRLNFMREKINIFSNNDVTIKNLVKKTLDWYKFYFNTIK
jgi:hypothetical protein